MATSGTLSSNHAACLGPKSAKFDLSRRVSVVSSPNSRCHKSVTVRAAQGNPETKQAKDMSTNLFNNASNALTSLLSIGSPKGMPRAEGQASDLFSRPLFYALYDWFREHGGVYLLAFGPKCFVVVSDPLVARHILRDNAFSFDKGVLAELLEPIMGKGLIPADLDTWKVRRRAIVPGFHTAYLEAMVDVFGRCAERTVEKLQAQLEVAGSQGRAKVEMEAEYSSLALDIIGLSVFNYDFDSVTKESPVIQAVYGTLAEAEHRSTFYIPYWNLPLASVIVPRQRKFRADLKVINDCLDDLINKAMATRQEEDLEALQQRDYSKVKDASLLRFFVDMRGEDCTNRQLRDDLMTMLIAGHETTAAVLTWATFQLAQNPEVLAKLEAEVDAVLGDGRPTLTDIKSLQYTRLVIAEALRLYPQPPLLIRRSLKPEHFPPGHQGNPDGYEVPKGTDIFISVYNINRSPSFWDRPDDFFPDRFLLKKEPNGIEGWEGYDPARLGNSLYPNEIASDFAFLPFGGGPRKCVGDQFALMEATVGLAMLVRQFHISLATSPEEVKLVTGATMHTDGGLWCYVTPRKEREGADGLVAAGVAEGT